MTCLHLQGIGGASGDMLLAALLDLGVPRRALEEPLRRLGLGPFRLRVSRLRDRAPQGLRVEVAVPHDHGQARGHAHPHRGLREIEALFARAGLPGPVVEQSRRVFRRLAEAEARVHGTAPEEVHFHEVGAVDSLVDIVGACLARHHLGVTDVAVSPLPLGRGVVACAHGLLPLPAPATVDLLTGFPVETVDETLETVTPTGAAILTAWKTLERPPAGARLLGAGAGYGRHALRTRPNLLRAFLLDAGTAAGPDTDTCLVLECQLDDCPPEWIGDLLPRLLAAGALDAYTTAVFMKKQRPGILLTVLAPPERADALRGLVFRETTTFGIRSHPVERAVLARRTEAAATPFGDVGIKIGRWQDREVTRAPEYEDCAACARRAGVPLKAVYDAALRARPAAARARPPGKPARLPPGAHGHPHPHAHPPGVS